MDLDAYPDAQFSGTVVQVLQRRPDSGLDTGLLETFARKLMARKLEHRFASAREALAALELIASDPDEAALRLGIMDVARALAVVSLTDPSDR